MNPARQRSPARAPGATISGFVAVAGVLGLIAALLAGCSAASRHKVLSIFFDGVPDPAASSTTDPAPVADSSAEPSRRIGLVEHEPYASGDCAACHDRAATNRLVVPAEELCFQCHDLDLDQRYVHGPLASGGCQACHDPHSSPYRHLLVSDSDGFCLRCHDRSALTTTEGHRREVADCTECHDAHMSDRKYLLREEE